MKVLIAGGSGLIGQQLRTLLKNEEVYITSRSKKGDYIILRAQMNLVICLSACPQDITAICGNKPRNAHFEIY